MKSIKENFIWNTILKVSTILFPLIVFPYVSRTIGADGMGKVSFATSVIVYFSIVAQLGVPTYGIRSIAQVANDKIECSKRAQEILIINIITTSVAYLFFALSIIIVKRFQTDTILLLITSLEMGFNTIGMVWLFSGLEHYSFITKRSLAFKLISLVLIILLVKKPEDYVFSNVGSNIINLIYSRKFITYKKSGKYDFKRHIKPIITFFSMSVATTVYTSLDTVMLGFITDDYQVGYYNAAIKIRSVLLGVVNSLATVLLPRSSYYVKEHKIKEFIEISQKAFSFIAVIGFPLWIYFSVFSRECVLLLSGDSFLPAITPMFLIMPTVFICGISNLTAIQMLVSLNKEAVVLKSQIIGAIIDFALNFIFIPYYGASAAAAATMIAEFVIMIIQIKALHKENIFISKKTAFIKVISATFVAVFSSIVVKTLVNSTFWRLAISACLFFSVYCTVLLLLRESTIVYITKYVVNFLVKSRNN